ncbi:MAG: LysM peptidoglycan-binding domain-containing protein [Anaerolineales bacterium]
MTSKRMVWIALLLVTALMLNACQPSVGGVVPANPAAGSNPVAEDILPVDQPLPTPLAERPIYEPGELVDYIAQTGDTLPALAVRFNTTVEEIRQANPVIPDSATTMPPGMPMRIPIYYLPFWGPSYKILPDSLFVNGPAQVSFDTQQYLAGQPGWLKQHVEFAAGANRSASQIIDLIARDYSISPQLLLALLEYQTGAVTQPSPGGLDRAYPMGYRAPERRGLYLQLAWTANLLNNSFYGWRTTRLTSIERQGGRLMRFDPWLNAAAVSLQYIFDTLLPDADFEIAISSQGFNQTYQSLFGDPWAQDNPHIPGSLEQPALSLPFEVNAIWAYTGGPHNPWGSGDPLAALDFAPPLTGSGCIPSTEMATAIADGLVARSEYGEVVLDLDGDGDERTGWNIFYLHLATEKRSPEGVYLRSGDPIGFPSCEGGSSTGTHVHIARKYNGEWIPAEGTLAFNLEGWIAHNGTQPYLGTLTRNTQIVIACTCSNQTSFIRSDRR